MALTEEQVIEYRQKLSNKKYMEVAIYGVANKIVRAGASEKTLDIKTELNEMEEKNMEKNRLTDLNDHLFCQLERLNNDDLKGEELKDEISKAHAMVGVASQIIATGNLVLNAAKAVDSAMGKMKLPRHLLGE
jgi:hypothetical protein